jgi:hypothetical protein
VICQAANVTRARLLSQSIDPSVIDEHDPERRILELDIFDPRNPCTPRHATPRHAMQCNAAHRTASVHQPKAPAKAVAHNASANKRTRRRAVAP